GCVVSGGGSGDDGVGIATGCGAGPYVLTSSRSAETTADELRVLRVAADRLSETATLRMPGIVTALWSDPEAEGATAIVRHPTAARYDAFHVSLSCAR